MSGVTCHLHINALKYAWVNVIIVFINSGNRPLFSVLKFVYACKGGGEFTFTQLIYVIIANSFMSLLVKLLVVCYEIKYLIVLFKIK